MRIVSAAIAVVIVIGTVNSVGEGSGFRGGLSEAYGPLFKPSPYPLPPPEPPPRTDSVRAWNQIAIDAIGVDHTPVAPGENRVFGEQIGPGRSSRAMAIVHIAIFDAVNAIVGGYKSYTGLPRASLLTSFDAAVAQAAHDTLVALYPSQRPALDAKLEEDLRQNPDLFLAKTNGVRLGQRAAAAILAERANDGSQHAEPRVGVDFIPSDQPGFWRQDPISQIPIALGAFWGDVAPFALQTSDQYRVAPPPTLASVEHAIAYDEVKRLGGDGVVTPTERTLDQTIAGIYWGYDGTPVLGTPPRLYNQIAVTIADQLRVDRVSLARMLALVNVAMADAGIAIWEAKYFYQCWRPITGIREADPGTGPTGLGDGNPATEGDPNFIPLGAPASNLDAPNFTPPFPAYPSGHAGFGSALFQVLRRFFETDKIAFTFVSDEFNGKTRDNEGNVRPLLPRSFPSLSAAEEENGQSRIYLGIHWSFDKTDGIAQGRKIADYVFANTFQPEPPGLFPF